MLPLLATVLEAFPVKVLTIDGGTVRVLLPVHSVEMVAVTAPVELRWLEPGQWHEAALEAGDVSTTEKNCLVIKMPKKRVRLHLLSVVIKE